MTLIPEMNNNDVRNTAGTKNGNTNIIKKPRIIKIDPGMNPLSQLLDFPEVER
jgi:hypothetical protein